jgi:glycosyltransferase involved in cell wall biosynthesis
MKILYFSDHVSDHNRRFLKKISEAGLECWFLDPTADSLPGDWLPKAVHWVRIRKKLGRGLQPSQFAEFLPEFQDCVREIGPDLIHAGPTPTAGYVTALSGFHPWLLGTWGWDVLYQPEQGPEWRQATEFAVAKADAVYVDCEAARDRIRVFADIPDTRIVQFPMGIKRGTFGPDGDRPRPDEFAHEPGAYVFLSTRSWEPLYAVDVLLEAFRRAYSHNSCLRLLLLGSGSLEAQVREFVRVHKLDQVIQIPGRIGASETAKWFRAADVYISCARTDGTSVSLLEAMATGLPVVVTDIPSNREWVTNGQNGWLAASDSPQEFADRMLRAAQLTKERRKAISEQNQKLVADRADWDGNFPRLLKMYERLAALPVVP